MALLDMQGMELSAKGGDCYGSGVSLLLCDSAASVTLCV
jgi:Lanthionine-containing peptide SapB precursor RamS